MEELTIEQKAKAYDEAIKRLEDIKTGKCQKTFVFTESLFDYIFPELAESEDERIRKALISFLKSPFVNESITDEKVTPWIAWLEKQGEQKPILDVEIPFGAKDSELEEVSYNIPNGYHAEIEYNKVVIKKGEQKPIDTKNLETVISNILKCYSHIILHRSLTQYELNETDVYAAENTKKLLCFLEQKSVEWSDEDKKALKVITDIFEQYGVHLSNYPAFVHWLKTLPERISFNPYWKPSDEQMEYLAKAITTLGDEGDNKTSAILYELRTDLKKLK